MIGSRGGVSVTLCDGCFRPRREGEDGWTGGERLGGYWGPRTYPLGTELRDGKAFVPADWCPECAPATEGAGRA